MDVLDVDVAGVVEMNEMLEDILDVEETTEEAEIDVDVWDVPASLIAYTPLSLRTYTVPPDEA